MILDLLIKLFMLWNSNKTSYRSLSYKKIHKNVPEYIDTLLIILTFMKFCVAKTFMVELLEVLLVVGLKLVDKYHWKIH